MRWEKKALCSRKGNTAKGFLGSGPGRFSVIQTPVLLRSRILHGRGGHRSSLVYIGVICTSSQRCISMDPERVPVLPHSEVAPPVHGEDAPAPNLLSSSNPRTAVPIDTNNWVPFHDSSSSEKEVGKDVTCHLCDHN